MDNFKKILTEWNDPDYAKISVTVEHSDKNAISKLTDLLKDRNTRYDTKGSTNSICRINAYFTDADKISEFQRLASKVNASDESGKESYYNEASSNFVNVNIGIERSNQKLIDKFENLLTKKGVYFDNDGGDETTYNINAGFDNEDQGRRFADFAEKNGAYVDTETFLNEGQSKVEKIGNRFRVTDEDGTTTEYDEESYNAMKANEQTNEDVIGYFKDKLSGNKDSSETKDAFGREMTIQEIEDEIDAEFNQPIEEEDLTPDGLELSSPEELLDDSLEFTDEDDDLNAEMFPTDNVDSELDNYEIDADYDFDDMRDQPSYAPFDVKTQAKRLRAGTPIIFSDEIGGGEGTFIEKSASGFFGTAEKEGKRINIHLSDISAADLTSEHIYESFEKQFNQQLNEDISITTTDNPYNPELDTLTVTATGEDVGEIQELMSLAGMQNQESTDSLGGIADVSNEYTPYSELCTDDDLDGECDDFASLDSVYDEFDDDIVELIPEEEDEELANTPHEKVASSDVQLNKISGGLNRKKRQYDPGYQSDNPMTNEGYNNSFLDFYKRFNEHQ